MLATDKTELDSALRDLQTEVKSTQSIDPIKFSEIIKQKLENTLSTSQSQIQEINDHKLNETRNNPQEDQDKETRRNNIIIYRIPESDASCIEERKMMDNRFVLGLTAYHSFSGETTSPSLTVFASWACASRRTCRSTDMCLT